MKNILSLLICFLFGLLFIQGCAQIATPTGGKKDTLAPKLVKTFPINQSLNFKGKEIELTFNEYIKIDNIQQKLLITPGLEGVFTPKPNPTGIRIIFNEALKPNTTYNFNFRDAIKDATESNIAKNIRLVLSTGDKIDSLKVGGKIINIQTGNGMEDVNLGLYEYNDTLKPSKQKPYYFAKTDTSGLFNIENIKAGKYKIYAITDKNNNLLYEQKSESIGFINEVIDLKSNQENININIAKIDKEPNKVLKQRGTANYYYIDYNRPVAKVKVEFRNLKDSVNYQISEIRQLQFYNSKNTTDTIFAKIKVIDSLDNIFSHEVKIKFKPKTGKRDETIREKLEIKTNPVNGEDIELTEVGYSIDFNKPIRTVNLDKIKVLNDTLLRVPIKEEQLVWNDTKTLLTFKTTKNQQKPRENIRIQFQKGSFISIENDTSVAFINNHLLRNEDNYGIITGKINNKKHECFIIQLLDEKREVKASVYNQINYRFEYVKAGTYFVRVIIDENNNKRWDFGDIEKNIQPESIIYYPQKIKIKPNFELTDNDITL